MNDNIIIKGVRENNLKNIDLCLKRNQMIVFCGPSGSGKSSLVFDTIFAEGQRRYVESLSAYARQFLGKTHKADFDYIEGLSPTISIEQKISRHNPRSTIGTVTEIYDYYRLLFARIGQAYCPECHIRISEQSIDQIVDSVLLDSHQQKIMILAPLFVQKKGERNKILENIRKEGFQSIRLDGKIYNLDDLSHLDSHKKHSLDIVVDRIVMNKQERSRLSESIETALRVSKGKVIVVWIEQDNERLYSEINSCPQCNFSFSDIEPNLFSFNSPKGACPRCTGLGYISEFSINKVLPDLARSFYEDAFLPYKSSSSFAQYLFSALALYYPDFQLNLAWEKIPSVTQKLIFYGEDKPIIIHYGGGKDILFHGLQRDLHRRYRNVENEHIRKWFEKFMDQDVCPECHGQRINKSSLSVFINQHNIADLSRFTIKQSEDFFQSLHLSDKDYNIAQSIVKEIANRLKFLNNVGLEYLTIDRRSQTLSGGESQRIRLASQIGSSLVGILYILDEPTIGLHQRDNQRLIDTLLHLRDLGNTLLIVEHDEALIRISDYMVDIGPGSGIHGGEIVAQGPLAEIEKNPHSVTGPYIFGKKMIPMHAKRLIEEKDFLSIYCAQHNNLKNIDVHIPLNVLTVISGVSGSGKSTLLNYILFPYIHNRLMKTRHLEGKCEKIDGIEHLQRIILIDQNPIGRTPRSNPVTYIEVFIFIRRLFSQTKEARIRGYKEGRFSFNVKGGRCENCRGEGSIRVEMHFLPDVSVICDVCKGKKFNQETLEVVYKDKNIYDVLGLSVEEALIFFEGVSAITQKLKILYDVGLGYITLGQSALTLSGGEAQRIKLAFELSKRSAKKTLYVIDEPTTGLHFQDIDVLMKLIHHIVDKGNTVILIEHNLDVIKQADYIVDLGPEGGDKGGYIVFQGAFHSFLKTHSSYTAQYLQQYFSCV